MKDFNSIPPFYSHKLQYVMRDLKSNVIPLSKLINLKFILLRHVWVLHVLLCILHHQRQNWIWTSIGEYFFHMFLIVCSTILPLHNLRFNHYSRALAHHKRNFILSELYCTHIWISFSHTHKPQNHNQTKKFLISLNIINKKKKFSKAASGNLVYKRQIFPVVDL